MGSKVDEKTLCTESADKPLANAIDAAVEHSNKGCVAMQSVRAEMATEIPKGRTRELRLPPMRARAMRCVTSPKSTAKPLGIDDTHHEDARHDSN